MTKLDNHYVCERELFYELVLAHGRGKPSTKLVNMFMLIAKNLIKKKQHTYRSQMDMDDILQSMMLHILTAYKKFNHKRFDKSFPYITELFKRQMITAFYEIHGVKTYDNNTYTFISMDTGNDGNRLTCF